MNKISNKYITANLLKKKAKNFFLTPICYKIVVAFRYKKKYHKYMFYLYVAAYAETYFYFAMSHN